MCRYDGDWEGPAFCSDVQRKARKAHKCYECGREITTGEYYHKTSGLWDGRFRMFKRCEHCEVLLRWLGRECGSYVYGEVVSDVREHVEEYGVREYGFGLARLVVLAGKKWTRAGSLTEVPAIPAPPRPTQEISDEG